MSASSSTAPTSSHHATPMPVPAAMPSASLQQSLNVLSTVSPLPAGWIQQIDVSSGSPFYVNTATGQSTWHRPVANVSAQPPPSIQPHVSHHETAPLPAGWIQQIDVSSGSPFYVNTASGQSTWHRPVANVSAQPPPSIQPHFSHHETAPLPAGWIRCIDPATNSPFWVNTATGQSSWQPPAPPATAPCPTSASDSPPHSAMSTTLPASSLQSESSLSLSAKPSSSATSSLSAVTHALSALSFSGPGVHASIPDTGVIWKWESDDGSKFIDFHPDVSAALENAFAGGQHTFKIPVKSWLFDFRTMTQSNYQTQSKRRIKRMSAAGDSVAAPAQLVASTTDSVASAALQHSKSVQHPKSDHSAVQQAPAASSAGQSKAATLDFSAAIGKLALAAKGIPIDIVYGVYVRQGHNVDAANELLAQFNQLYDICGNRFSFADIEAAMIASSDSLDAALEMLLQQAPAGPEKAVEVHADAAPASGAAPDPAAPILQDEHAPCIICMDNMPTHAFIPCGHKHICSDCNGDKAVVDGLHGKCPTCSAPFTMILHIFEG
jgi:hypothetical protein